MRGLLSLRSNDEGSTIIEFAIIGPAFIALLIGVLQVGLGMQSYNAVRNVSSEVARETMIEYTTGNKISKGQIRSNAISIGTSAPYLLDETLMNVAVWEPTDQRVDGATEYSIRIRYQVPMILNFMGWNGPTVEHVRPIFVVENTPPTP